MPNNSDRSLRWRRYWDKHAPSYDRQISGAERAFFGDSREWICSRARGDVLEVAIGTGLNLAHYPDSVRITGVEWSPAMLTLARSRARDLRLAAELLEGDAQALPFPEATFDTVVCTFSLCAIPDHRVAIDEMRRVLRPGGRLLLADHVASTRFPIRIAQRLLELATVPLGGEHFLRRPRIDVEAAGFRIDQAERFKAGLVERLAATRAVAG